MSLFKAKETTEQYGRLVTTPARPVFTGEVFPEGEIGFGKLCVTLE